MLPPMLQIYAPVVLRLSLFAVAVFIVAQIVPGIRVRNFGTAILVAIVYGFFNYLTYHIFWMFSVPFAALTLGLGFWILNTILLVLTDKVVDSFRVDGLIWAAIGSALISIVNAGLVHLISASHGFFRMHSFQNF